MKFIIKMLLTSILLVLLTACESKTTQEEVNATTIQNSTTTETPVDTDTSTNDADTVTGTDTRSDGSNTTPQAQTSTPAVLTRLSLESNVTTLNAGETAELTVIGTYSDGSTKEVETGIEYISTPRYSLYIDGNTVTMLETALTRESARGIVYAIWVKP